MVHFSIFKPRPLNQMLIFSIQNTPPSEKVTLCLDTWRRHRGRRGVGLFLPRSWLAGTEADASQMQFGANSYTHPYPKEKVRSSEHTSSKQNWFSLVCACLTSPFSKALMKAQLSLEQERTVSVLPSRNNRVIDASYVRQNIPLFYKQERENMRERE